MQPRKPELIIPDWPAPLNIGACTTTRLGGYSDGNWSSFNLADHVADDISAVQKNRKLLIEHLHLPSQPVWLRQVHGCDVCIVDYKVEQPVSDASICSQTGMVCAVLTADCLPLLMCDDQGTVVSAVHAGWRGLAAGVVEQTISRLPAACENIMAWLGPAIGPNAFEVGDDVYDVFTQYNPAANAAFSRHADRWLCDIYLLARQRLQNAGINRIYGGGLCTFTDERRFYSYRRDGTTGRMASLIWIK